MRTVLVWLGLCYLPAVSAFAQRELHWSNLEVSAHLNADGTLNVAETQTIVFTGDWNGGERKFNIRPRQQVSLTGVYRGGPGGWQALTEDSSLDDVDEYAWTDERTLRWRSRRSSDPPFAATSIRYELRYVLSGILLKEDERYRLDHDFAFPDRSGTIERFALRLTVDPAWQPLAELRPLYTAGPLAPDTSFVLPLPLHYAGLGVPVALDLTRSPEIVNGVAAVLGVTMLAVLWFFVREQRYGRFTPLTQQVDEPWLREHILKYPAEVVAAAWDENVGTAEVVALIARMVSDGKLESSVGKGTGKSASMTLRLKVDRSTLQGHERTLVEKLFFDGRSETSTSEVRAHYRAAGFNPASEIQPELQAAVDSMLLAGRSPRRFKAISFVLFALGTGLLVVRWFQGYPIAVALTLAMVVLAGIGWIAGGQFRAYLEWGRGAAWLCLIPALTIAVGVSLYLWFYAGTGAVELDSFSIFGIVAVALSCVHSAINSLKSRRSREAIAFRKALTAGRAFFIQELRKERPALSDEWYPWVLAFELGKQADAWSTERAGSDTPFGRGSSGSSQSTASSSEERWTGFGGGRSGGAGGGASWQAAASGMAASVSPPSSSGSSGSSSSGGSSSGGSSGGGGGGGW
jgi:Predicted membrane protein (DUF2207) N-terminal domain